MSFVERFIIPCPYLGESTIRGSTVHLEATSSAYIDNNQSGPTNLSSLLYIIIYSAS